MMPTLNEIEVRVLASLVEKEITTPEYYPLTLNALVNACNQKSNRNPVVSYDGQTVGDAISSLKEKALVSVVMGGDSRVPKYRNYFAEAYELTPQEVAVLNVLMLRGPQTLGELRSRTERLYDFTDIGDIEVVLEGLAMRSDSPLVAKLPRQVGQKEGRYAHLLAGEPIILDEEESILVGHETKSDRIQRLEDEVAQLRQDLNDLKRTFADFQRQFE